MTTTRPTITTAALLTVAALAANCGVPTGLCGCSPVPDWTVVTGDVTTSTGPVADVQVRIGAVRAGDTVIAWERDSTATDGRYLIDLPGDYFGETWFVRAEPDSGAGLAPATVDFVPRFAAYDIRDTVRVDILLSPR